MARSFSAGDDATCGAALVAPEIAVFYPPSFQCSDHLPSVALLKEPSETGPLPKDWTLRPVFRQHDGHATIEIELAVDIDLYGTGEVTGRLRRNGYAVELWNTDNPVYARAQGRRLYQSHPWVLGLEPDGGAFGVLHDSTWRQEIVCGRSLRFEMDSAPGRVFVVRGGNPLDVVQKLAQLTGKIELPPLWSLGYHQCRWSYYPDARVREVTRSFRERGIPLDVMWLDIHYMDEYRVFTFDQHRFPDPAATNGFLHRHDVKSVWMIDPGVKFEDGYDVYDTGSTADIWIKDPSGVPSVGQVWPGDVVFPDFTMTKTHEWWAEQFVSFLPHGIDGVWNDMNEPAVFDHDTWTLPESAVHGGGVSIGDDDQPLPPGPHLRYHNIYGMLMIRATKEAIRRHRPEKRPFVLTRANFLGGQRYGATWTGDNKSSWEHLKMSIPMSLNLSLSGQPFSGPDIGGFDGNATPELFGHWMALGAYFPFCRGHTIEASLDHEPWSFGPEIEEVCRHALRKRYALMPYLYTLFHASSQSGDPIMCPVFMADPAEQSLRTVDDRFLLGSDLLVEPSWSEGEFPPFDAWAEFEPVLQDAMDPRYEVALKQRPGSIVPTVAPTEATSRIDLGTLALSIVPDADGRALGKFYWDEGDGWGYDQGVFSLVTFLADVNSGSLVIRAETQGDMKLLLDQLTISLWQDKEWVRQSLSWADILAS